MNDTDLKFKQYFLEKFKIFVRKPETKNVKKEKKKLFALFIAILLN